MEIDSSTCALIKVVFLETFCITKKSYHHEPAIYDCGICKMTLFFVALEFNFLSGELVQSLAMVSYKVPMLTP